MKPMRIRKGLILASMVFLMAGAHPASVMASGYQLGYNTNASDNDYISTTKAPRGRVGKSMSISFRVRATDEDMDNLKISLLETNDFQQIEERGNGDYTVDYYPFEIMETTFLAKNVGNIKKGNIKSVSLSANVRRDAQQGYYSIPILLEWDGGSDIDYINIWISTDTSSGADDEEDKKEGNYFVIGENQSTPRGVYPNVMNYTVNFRNKRNTTAQDVTISMQLSEDDIISYMEDTLKELGLPPSHVVMELTETYLATADEETLRMLNDMKAAGIRVAMDDFGVGYSSLFSLKTIPVDIVKIDRGFVKCITSDLFNATFIRSITEMCHDVGKQVCLEGGETGEEYLAVKELGMEYIQGFYFGRPEPPDVFEKRLKCLKE